MRKLRIYLMLMLSLTGMAAFGQGANNPLTINNLDDLIEFRDVMNLGGFYQGVSSGNGFDGVYFKMTADIDMGSIQNWQPIGTPLANFGGHFDGDNHIITNLRCVYPNMNAVGLFAYTYDGSIQNLHIDKGTVQGKDRVGSVCGDAFGTIFSNCSNTADVTGNEYVGSLIGFVMSGQISDCNNITDVHGIEEVGGIAGYAGSTTVRNCLNRGKVYGENKVGGITAYNTMFEELGGIFDCENYGDIIVTMDNFNYSYAGGIAAYVTSSVVSNCNNYGDVTSTGDLVSGIVPRSSGSVDHCINMGKITGSQYVSGITSDADVNYCMNLGMIVGGRFKVSGISCGNLIHASINLGDVYGGYDVGGISGGSLNEAVYTDCINAGNVFAYGEEVGAISGFFSEHGYTVENCFWDKQICNLDYGIGGFDINNGTTPCLTSEMTGFALQSVLNPDEWVFTEGLYPYPAGLSNVPLARLGASPIFLSYSDDDFEISQVILSDFDITVVDGLSWSSTTGKVSISGNHVSIVENGYDTLNITDNQDLYRRIPIVVNPGGTLENPLTIDNEQDLIDFTNAVNDFESGYYKGLKNKNDGYKRHYFIMTADLDMQDYSNFEPVGKFNWPFRGDFDGKNHTISNLTVTDTDEEHCGLFGALEYAVIDSINLMNVNITGTSWVGGVSAYADESMIRACHAFGRISGKNNFTGGICAQIYGNSTICDCSFGGIVDGYRYAGGITAGSSNSFIERCINFASVSGNNSIGGIIGMSNCVDQVNNCFNAGTVTARQMDAGGICGYSFIGTFNDNLSVGSVYCDLRAGGICGNDTLSTYSNCFYDNQMCIYGGFRGTDIQGVAEGLSTNDFVGDGLVSNLNHDIWSFNDNVYPTVSTIYQEDFKAVARTPIFLQNDEVVNDVYTDFTVGTTDNVSWSSSNTAVIEINDENAHVILSGETFLSASRNEISKSVKVYTMDFYGIDDQYVAGNVSVYPNPVRNQLYINAENINNVRIFNVSGQVVYRTNENVIDVTNLENGIYIVEVETDTERFVEKIMKN